MTLVLVVLALIMLFWLIRAWLRSIDDRYRKLRCEIGGRGCFSVIAARNQSKGRI